MGCGGLAFDQESNYRDVAWIGDCDAGCRALAEALGWEADLQQLIAKKISVGVEGSSDSEQEAAGVCCANMLNKVNKGCNNKNLFFQKLRCNFHGNG